MHCSHNLVPILKMSHNKKNGNDNKAPATASVGGALPKGTRMTSAKMSLEFEVPEEIRVMRDCPMQVVIALDSSGSMALPTSEDKDAKTRFQEAVVCVKGMTSLLDPSKNDWLSLYTFSEEPRQLVPMGPVGENKGLLDRQLIRLDHEVPQRGTALYDTVVRCANSLQPDPGAHCWLFVITDGLDEDSVLFKDDPEAKKEHKSPGDGPMLGCRKVHTELLRVKERYPSLHVSVMAVNIKTTDKAFGLMQMMVGHAASNSVGEVYSVKSGARALVRKCEEVISTRMKKITMEKDVNPRDALKMMITSGCETEVKDQPKLLTTGNEPKACTFFAQGKCKKGKLCRFSHDVALAKSTLGHDPIQGLLSAASTCNCPTWMETGFCVNLGHGACPMLHDPSVKGIKKKQAAVKL